MNFWKYCKAFLPWGKKDTPAVCNQEVVEPEVPPVIVHKKPPRRPMSREQNIQRLFAAGLVEPGTHHLEITLLKRTEEGLTVYERNLALENDPFRRASDQGGLCFSGQCFFILRPEDSLEDFLPWEHTKKYVSIQATYHGIRHALVNLESLLTPEDFPGYDDPMRIILVEAIRRADDNQPKTFYRDKFHLLLKVYTDLSWIEHGWQGPFIVVDAEEVKGVVTSSKPTLVSELLKDLDVKIDELIFSEDFKKYFPEEQPAILHFRDRSVALRERLKDYL